MALAAMAAVVGCAKEQMPANVENGINIVASISVDETRVTVEGEKFTDVKWEAGDAVTLSSVAGASATLNATEAGDTDVRFTGEGVLVADVDTYYAVYPATTIEAGVVLFNLATQSGDDAAILVAKAEGAQRGAIDMNFTPANSLLHVAVSGVETLAKAEFKAYNGEDVPSVFTYNFVDGTSAATQGVEALVVENPAVEGFFFSLPADLDMTDGYVVSLTDAQGNVCSKAYNGKTFAKGTTTRVDIAWSLPVVTLDAKTSYSYYTAGDAATANACANNAIYFGASTYANIQNAMVAEAGFIVDGQEYVATIDTATKSFSLDSVTVSSWGAKSVEAYIKTKDGAMYKSAAQSVQITGLPYKFQFYKSTNESVDAAGWKRNGGAEIAMDLMNIHEGGFAGSSTGWIASPGYYAPANIETTAIIKAKYYVATTSPSKQKAQLHVGATSSNTTSSSSSKQLELIGTNSTDSNESWSTVTTDLSLSTGVRYVSINHNKATHWLGSRIYVCDFELKYK